MTSMLTEAHAYMTVQIQTVGTTRVVHAILEEDLVCMRDSRKE